MTRPGSDSDLTETMLYNLNSGPDTLAALVKTLDFLSEAVCAMASSNAISLDYSYASAEPHINPSVKIPYPLCNLTKRIDNP